MCGIITAFNLGKNKEPINQYIREQLEDQKSRGMNGFGAIFINKNRTFTIRRATDPASIHVDLALNKSNMIMLHHRWPTSSENKIKQTHPIIVSNGSLTHDYLIIHNGIITNSDELKKKHEDLGFTYTTDPDTLKRFNDSESLAIETARYIEKQTTEMDTQGSFAFVALQVNKKTNKVENLLFGRNTSPLNLALSWTTLKLTSEGAGDEIKPLILYKISLININKKNFTKFKLTQSPLQIKPEPPPTPIIYNYKQPTEMGFRLKPNAKIHHPQNIYNNYQPNIYEETPEELWIEDVRDTATTLVDTFIDDITYSDDPRSMDIKPYVEEFTTILQDIIKKAEEIQIKNLYTEDKLINV